ncbi:MAG: VOC family protein [Candidatus Manganitrophaceae bacterium]
MIDHAGINVSNLALSKQFYKSALAPLGYLIRLELESTVGYGTKNPNPGDDPDGDFWISKGDPFVPRSHIAFHASSRDQVVAFYEAALAAGARDNGAPGLCPEYHKSYFAAFVFDPDGYNIEAVFHGAY